MITNPFDKALSDALGPPGPFTKVAVEDLFYDVLARKAGHIETAFSRAGFYDRSATPYASPASPWTGDEKRPADGRPVVRVRRALWLVRFNPNPKPRLGEDPAATGGLDVADRAEFDWDDPSGAVKFGWTVDSYWSRSGPALSVIEAGDLVVVQRTDPGTGRRKPTDNLRGNLLFGLCTVLAVRTYDDAAEKTPRLRRSACLLPLVKFNAPVPRDTAKRLGRLSGNSFTNAMQKPGRAGGLSRHLSSVEGDDILDVLDVCGVSPEVLAEPNVAVIASRLRSSITGSPEYLGLRFDHVLRNNARVEQARQACDHAKEWANKRRYTLFSDDQICPLAGYDLLFVDGSGKQLQVEVKGYSSKSLARVHLQPSQYLRAEDASKGNPPDWRLFALLGAGTQLALERKVLKPARTLMRVAAKKLQVKGGAKAVEELRVRWPREPC